jgi:hypothetical protein
MKGLPTWEEDTPLRCEMLRLESLERQLRIAVNSADERRVAKLTNEVKDCRSRIDAFMRGHRSGRDFHFAMGGKSDAFIDLSSLVA